MGKNVRRSTFFVVLTALGGAIALSTLIAYWHTRSQRFSVGYENVQVGNSKEMVAQLFGDKPSEVTPCNDPHGELGGKCAEVYWYFSFLERWQILFDRDGKVIDKGHNVLF